MDAVSPQPIRYYVEKGPMGEPSEVKEFKILSMHPDSIQNSAQNSDKKYFIRIATSSKSAEHTWIKVWTPMELTAVQYWSTFESQLDIQQLLTSSNRIEIQLKTDPTKAFILPPNRKFELILDPEAHILIIQLIDPSSDLDAVRIAWAEPIHDESDQSPPNFSSPDSFFNSNNTFHGKNSTKNESELFGQSPRRIPTQPQQSTQQQAVTEPFYEIMIDDKKRSVTVAVGSCLQQRFERLRAFGAMSYTKPDIIVLTGDNVYLDMIPHQIGCGKCLSNIIEDNDNCFPWCFNWCWKVEALNASEEYKRLLRHPDAPKTTKDWNPIWLATWDDHDYGKDNSDASNPQKLTNKRAFIQFYNELNKQKSWIRSDPEIFAMIQNDDRGIYHHYNHKQLTVDGMVDIQFIMLDVRYHKTKEDMLGREQWKWLQELVEGISRTKPNWVVFVLGTTFLLEHPPIVKKIGGESWDAVSRQRLERFMTETGLPRERILILSGDVHYSIIHDSKGLKELTVSSFTHSLDPIQKCCGTNKNQFAITDVTCVNGYGLLQFTPNTWKFELRSADQVPYIPHQVTAQQMQ